MAWPALAPYDEWSATCDTLHAHTQVLGKLAAVLAPPEPQLQHSALRLTARGWETLPLPAPDGSGVFVSSVTLSRSRETEAGLSLFCPENVRSIQSPVISLRDPQLP